MGGESEKEVSGKSAVSLLKWKNLLIMLVSIYVATALVIWLHSYHKNVIKNCYVTNDDSLQQIFVFYKVDNKPFSNASMIAKYYEDCLPGGYKLLYNAAAEFGTDPLLFSKLLSAFLFFATIALAAVLGLKKSGIVGFTFMFTAIFVCEGFFERMAGGLPRAFGYPLAFMFVYGAFNGKLIPLIASLILSVLFYPPLAFFFGGYLMLVFLAPVRLGFFVLNAWSWQRRIIFFGVVMLMCFVLILPLIKGSMSWGPTLDNKELETMPEMSLRGRYETLDRTPSPSFFQAVDAIRHRVFTLFNRPQGEGQIPITGRYGISFLLLCFLPWFICRKDKIFPLTILWFFLMFCYEISSIVYPKLFIPTRFVTYLMPVFFLSGFILVIGELKDFLLRFDKGRYVKSGVILLVLIAGLIYAPSARRGFSYDFRPMAPLYDAIRKLPEDTMIAGWPDPVLDAVPLFGRRAILIGYETYQLFHKHYLFFVRERMDDTIRLLFTENWKEFKFLKEKHNITHVLLPLRIYQKCDSLYIFSPFTEQATKLCRQTSNPIIGSLDTKYTIWSNGGYVLVDLRNVN